MARVTIEDCLKNVPSRFALVHMAALRVRQIREGANILVKSSKNEDAVMALREIAANRIVLKQNPKKKG
ncbi:MAG: DNA-directed RNA polymerase subunit omega [Desulfobacterium sp.]|nr:DNA-directed RNA polymerase subunit omega [Desulfobacterium sp.]